MTKDHEKDNHYRTHQIWIKKGHRMYEYFQTMTQNAKNMYNTTNFYIRQVYTGFTQEKQLQSLQKEVLDTIDHTFDKMNEVQLHGVSKKGRKAKS